MFNVQFSYLYQEEIASEAVLFHSEIMQTETGIHLIPSFS